MGDMAARIATARRNWRTGNPFGEPDRSYAYRPGGVVCPVCLREGRKCQGCRTEDGERGA